MLQKSQSLAVSEIVFQLVSNDEDSYGYLDTFNNCRETGLVLKDFSTDTCVWVYENRNSDSIVVAHGSYNQCDNNNMFSEDVYETNRQFFRYDDYHKASKHVLEILKTNKEAINDKI